MQYRIFSLTFALLLDAVLSTWSTYPPALSLFSPQHALLCTKHFGEHALLNLRGGNDTSETDFIPLLHLVHLQREDAHASSNSGLPSVVLDRFLQGRTEGRRLD